MKRNVSSKSAKNVVTIVEFSFGFAVVCNGERIGLCADEDDAKRIARRAKRLGR